MSSNPTDRPTLLQLALIGLQKVQAKHPDAWLIDLKASSKDSRPITDPTGLASIS
jgi:hypothetical protein